MFLTGCELLSWELTAYTVVTLVAEGGWLVRQMAEGTAPVSGQRHISILKAFAGGDMCEWLTRFEICARANAWTDERKALTLPTLLEG